jgi:hypothetical protein
MAAKTHQRINHLFDLPTLPPSRLQRDPANAKTDQNGKTFYPHTRHSIAGTSPTALHGMSNPFNLLRNMSSSSSPSKDNVFHAIQQATEVIADYMSRSSDYNIQESTIDTRRLHDLAQRVNRGFAVGTDTDLTIILQILRAVNLSEYSSNSSNGSNNIAELSDRIKRSSDVDHILAATLAKRESEGADADGPLRFVNYRKPYSSTASSVNTPNSTAHSIAEDYGHETAMKDSEDMMVPSSTSGSSPAIKPAPLSTTSTVLSKLDEIPDVVDIAISTIVIEDTDETLLKDSSPDSIRTISTPQSTPLDGSRMQNLPIISETHTPEINLPVISDTHTTGENLPNLTRPSEHPKPAIKYGKWMSLVTTPTTSLPRSSEVMVPVFVYDEEEGCQFLSVAPCTTVHEVRFQALNKIGMVNFTEKYQIYLQERVDGMLYEF